MENINLEIQEARKISLDIIIGEYILNFRLDKDFLKRGKNTEHKLNLMDKLNFTKIKNLAHERHKYVEIGAIHSLGGNFCNMCK